LQGILTAFEHANTEAVVVATVDMPGVQHEQLKWIVSQLHERQELLGAMSLKANGEIEPLPSAYRVAVRKVIEQAIAAQRRSVQALAKLEKIEAIRSPWTEEVWINLNTPADLMDFEAALDRHRL
jgi:molybdopterin-guanine dinucleotide biosynthesis protein A